LKPAGWAIVILALYFVILALYFVIPAKAGIQNSPKKAGSPLSRG
jgi:hypothetical protein